MKSRPWSSLAKERRTRLMKRGLCIWCANEKAVYPCGLGENCATVNREKARERNYRNYKPIRGRGKRYGPRKPTTDVMPVK